MKFGNCELFVLSDGTFWIDGGANFGVIPKVLWSKLTPVDELNRVELKINCLLVKKDGKNILVDTGLGDKYNEKFKNTFKINRTENLLDSLKNIGLTPEDIDIVINTHLHFDHCGGNTRIINNKIVPTFPKAKYVIQKGEWEDAMNPTERTRSTYLKENFVPIKDAGLLWIIEGDTEILPDIKTIVSGGHTTYNQMVLIVEGDKKAFYPGDVIPSTLYIKPHYVSGYDLYPVEVMRKKKELLEKAFNEHWLIIFDHDTKVEMGYLKKEDAKFIMSTTS